MKNLSITEVAADVPQATVPQMRKSLEDIVTRMARDPCLDDLAPIGAYLIGQIEERCRLAADVAAEIGAEHEVH